MTNDPIAEARRVLATSSAYHELCGAVLGLLSHVEALAAERDLANEYVNAASIRVSRAEATVERLTVPVTGDRAELVDSAAQRYYAREREVALFDGPEKRAWDELSILERNLRRDMMHKAIASLLEADARSEVALAEAIREIKEALNEWVGAESKLHRIRTILTKVADGGER